MWFIIITVITFHTKSLGGILREGGGGHPLEPWQWAVCGALDKPHDVAKTRAMLAKV